MKALLTLIQTYQQKNKYYRYLCATKLDCFDLENDPKLFLNFGDVIKPPPSCFLLQAKLLYDNCLQTLHITSIDILTTRNKLLLKRIKR